MINNELYLRGKRKDIERILSVITSNNEFTYNKFMPIPDELDCMMCTQPSQKDIQLVKKEQNNEPLTDDEKIFLDSERYDNVLIDKNFEINERKSTVREVISKQIKLYDKFGAYTWADWCLIHWGTRKPVNESNIKVLINTDILTTVKIEFDTDYLLPSRFLLCLSKLHPNVSIKVVYDVGGDEEESFTLPLDTERLKAMHKKALSLAKDLQSIA